MQQGGIRQSNQFSRNKSISEANLLATEYTRGIPPSSQMRDPRRNSVAEFSHHHEFIDHSHMVRPVSKAESHLSLTTSRRGPSVIRADYLAQEDESGPSFIYPHLQVGGVGIWPKESCIESKQHLLLNDISFEIRGGEIMAVMATNEKEGTALLDLVAGLTKPVVGDIILNGQNIRTTALKSRVAYVQSDPHLCKDMTAVQTLRYHYDLKKPTDKLGYLKIDAIDRVNCDFKNTVTLLIFLTDKRSNRRFGFRTSP